MRFEIQKQTKRGLECLERLGRIYYEKERFGAEFTTTPSCTLYLSTGCVPFVTNDLLKDIPSLPKITEIPLSTIVENKDNLMALKMPFSSLIRMEDFYTVLTLHDNSRWVQDGFSEGQKVAVWSKRGKTLISKESFTEFVNTVKFDLIECPYDDHYSKIESKKRLKKALDRTQGFIDTIFATEGITVENVLSELIMPLIGNEDESIRKIFVDRIVKSEYKFKGVVYHGLEKNKETLVVTDLKKYESIIRTLNKELDEKDANIFRKFPLALSPEKVVEAVELGFDLFTGSYPYILTDKRQALMFDYEMNEDNEDPETPAKRIKREKAPTVLDLNDKSLKSDFSPLKANCTCFTCKNFTRAYLNHLIHTKEISGLTLLMMHNMTSYFLFFENLRSAIEKDNFQDYKEFILKQFNTN